jgi:hypothetical protein
MIETLAQIKAKGAKPFTAGLVLWDNKVVEAAPIVRYMKGWSRDRARSYCESKGWKVTVVHELQRPQPIGIDTNRGSGHFSV